MCKPPAHSLVLTCLGQRRQTSQVEAEEYSMNDP